MSLCLIQNPEILFCKTSENLGRGAIFQPVSSSASIKESVSLWCQAARMKRNEFVNPEILSVTHGQTRVNLLSFNQFQHDRFSCVFQRAHLLLKQATEETRHKGRAWRRKINKANRGIVSVSSSRLALIIVFSHRRKVV